VLAVFSFVWHWNDFMGPLIYLIQYEEKYPLSLGLFRFTGPYGQTEFSYLMAASTVVLLPVLALFLFAQRYFIEGITLTGLKG
ncbi:MAG: carbohydrate ABC transporter permease, partial [bacterium]